MPTFHSRDCYTVTKVLRGVEERAGKIEKHTSNYNIDVVDHFFNHGLFLEQIQDEPLYVRNVRISIHETFVKVFLKDASWAPLLLQSANSFPLNHQHEKTPWRPPFSGSTWFLGLCWVWLNLLAFSRLEKLHRQQNVWEEGLFGILKKESSPSCTCYPQDAQKQGKESSLTSVQHLHCPTNQLPVGVLDSVLIWSTVWL